MKRLIGMRWEVDDTTTFENQNVVLRGRDITGQYDGPCAIKLIRQDEEIANFENEVRTMKAVAHPYIIPLIDHAPLSITSDEPYIVTPWGNMGDLANKKHLALVHHSFDAVMWFLKQAIDAVEALHAAEVIHRDIKPANFILHGAGPDIWLTDFALSFFRIEEKDGKTIENMPPRAYALDIRGIGTSLFFLLMGGVPWNDTTKLEPLATKPIARDKRYDGIVDMLAHMICPLKGRYKNITELRAAFARL